VCQRSDAQKAGLKEHQEVCEERAEDSLRTTEQAGLGTREWQAHGSAAVSFASICKAEDNFPCLVGILSSLPMQCSSYLASG
jgi:hypothetical protein